MKKLNQSGSHVLAVVLLLVVIGAVGFAGYKVSQSNKPKSDTTTQTATTKTATVPSTISTSAQLTQAGDVLDQSNAQLNNNLDDSSLNADLNSML